MKRWHLILIGIAIAVASYFFYKEFKRVKNQVSVQSELLKEREAVINIYRSRSGLWVADRQAANLRINTLNRYVDSLKNLPKKAISYSNVKTKTTKEFKVKTDTTFKDGEIYYKPGSFKSEWFEFNSYSFGDELKVSVNIIDSLELMTYWEKKIFGTDQLRQKVISHNLDTKVLQTRNFTATGPERKAKRFAVTIGAGYGLSPKIDNSGNTDYLNPVLTPSINLSVGFILFRF